MASDRARYLSGKGGMFSGQLVIGKKELTQGNCLPATATASPGKKRRISCLSPHCPRLRVAVMRKAVPRSPYERLGGYVHLPRLIDKAKLQPQSLLDGYNYKTVGSINTCGVLRLSRTHSKQQSIASMTTRQSSSDRQNGVKNSAEQIGRMESRR